PGRPRPTVGRATRSRGLERRARRTALRCTGARAAREPDVQRAARRSRGGADAVHLRSAEAMVSGARPRSAPGFGLAEVLVALIVLTVGVMGAVATATLAVRTLHIAAEREAAVRAAGVVLDSLLQV